MFCAAVSSHCPASDALGRVMVDRAETGGGALLSVTTDVPADPGAPVTVRPLGEVDHFSVAPLQAALRHWCDAGRDVQVDLSEVSFMDASAVTAIAEASRQLAAQGCRCRVVGASRMARRLLAICHLEQLLG
jgi:anti-anti-sigma factor